MTDALSTAVQTRLRAILGETAYAGLQPVDACELLNAPTIVSNPVAQGAIPAPMSVGELAGLLSTASRAAVLNYPSFGVIAEDIRGQECAEVGLWAANLGPGVLNLITSAESTALAAYSARTIPDPAWPATVPGPSRAVQEWGSGGFVLAGITYSVFPIGAVRQALS